MHWCFGPACAWCKYLREYIGRILLTFLISLSAFTFILGVGISATDMISRHDSVQDSRISVLESRVITLDASVLDIKAKMESRESVREEGRLYVLGALITSIGTFLAAVVAAIYSRGSYRHRNGKGG